MKKLLNVLLSTAIVTTPVFASTFAPTSNEVSRFCVGEFPDTTSENSLCPYVEYLYSQGVVNGYSDGSFHPDDLVTRAQFAKMVVNAFQLEIGAGESSFPDVPTTNKFFNEIGTLKSLGIINGFSDGTFRPEEEVTRGAAMKFIVNAALQKNEMLFPETSKSALSVFSDVPDSHTFASFIARAYSVEDPSLVETVIGGYSDGTFRPDINMTRAQVTKVLTNSMKYGQLELKDCSMYFCQDMYRNSDGAISGQYFNLTYDPYFWFKESSVGSLVMFPEMPPEYISNGQYNTLTSISVGNSVIFFSAFDMSSLSEFSDVTIEQAGLESMGDVNLSVNEYLGQMIVEGIEQNGFLDSEHPVEIIGAGNSSNGDYIIELKSTEILLNDITFKNAYGCLVVGIRNNTLYVHIGITENESNQYMLKNTLNNVSYN